MKKIVRYIYNYWHKYWILSRLKKFNKFNNNYLSNCNVVKLNIAVPGTYKVKSILCYDKKLELRLIEIGFISGERLTVVRNIGPIGNIIVKIKGSKIALSNKISDKILIKRK
ncbi:MAG: ferrous iron transport protein A [Endomicrobium sp.]|nr:ferrous iron transport protein A [Endomicrobium sp.]